MNKNINFEFIQHGSDEENRNFLNKFLHEYTRYLWFFILNPELSEKAKDNLLLMKDGS